MVCDCPITNTTFWLPLFPMLFLCNKSKVSIFPPTPSNWMFNFSIKLCFCTRCVLPGPLVLKQLVFFHGSGVMVLIVCDQTFLLLDGTIHVIFLRNNVGNYTLHGLSNSRTRFTIVVDHTKMPRQKKLMVRDLELLILGQFKFQ